MSSLKALKKDILTSLGSMVSLDRSREDMENLSEAYRKPLNQSNDYIKAVGNPHKIQTLVDDISGIVKASEETIEKKAGKVKNNSHHVKSKDYLGNKKTRIPSAADLMNNPLRESYSGLESGENDSTTKSYRDFSNLTAKDLSKSLSNHLNMTPSGGSRSSRRGSLDVRKSAKLINSTLTSTIEIDVKRSNSGTALGITAKDLAKATKSSIEDASKKITKKKSSKESVGVAINKPFRKSMEAIGFSDKKEELPVMEIKAPEFSDMYIATKANHKKYAHEKI